MFEAPISGVTKKLGDLCQPERGITYGIVKVGDYVPGGVPVIRGGDIREDRIIFNDKKRVSSEVSEEFRRTVLRGGEIVLNLIAEPGHSAVVPSSMAGYNVSRDVAVICLRGEVNHVYINYYLKSAVSVDWLTARLQGSVTQKINLGTLREMPVVLPSRRYQDFIADMLSVLDSKIATNGRVASSADELRAVRLMEFLRSERGVRAPLSSIANFVNGRAFTKNATGEGRMVVRIAEINSGPSRSTIYNDIDVPHKHLARPGDILFSWSGSLAVARWYRSEAIVNQHIFKVIPQNALPSWLAFDLVRAELPRFQAIAAGKATTMGHIQRHHLDDEIQLPDPVQWSRLDAELGPLWASALEAETETLVLANLRDALLPKLMSGEIRIKDAERAVEDVV